MTQRLPPQVAKVTGADVRNPQRFTGRNDPNSPFLGEPSKHLDAKAKRCWRKFKSELPWLTEADRAMVDLAAALRSSIENMGMAGVTGVQVYSAVLSKLGASPVDQSRTSGFPDSGGRDEFFGD